MLYQRCGSWVLKNVQVMISGVDKKRTPCKGHIMGRNTDVEKRTMCLGAKQGSCKILKKCFDFGLS